MLIDLAANLFAHMRMIRRKTIGEEDRADRSIHDHMNIIQAIESARHRARRGRWCAPMRWGSPTTSPGTPIISTEQDHGRPPMAEAAVKTSKPASTDAPAAGAERELTDGFHLVIDALKLNGLTTIYGVPGIPITDLGRMAQAAGIRVISFRHEQNAGNAAAIAGFLTKKPGVCLTVSAPGFLNGCLVDPWRDRLRPTTQARTA